MHEIVLNHIGGTKAVFFFEAEEKADKCLADYAAKAKRAATFVGGNATESATRVGFDWDGPIGIIRWSAEKRRIQTDDHLWR